MKPFFAAGKLQNWKTSSPCKFSEISHLELRKKEGEEKAKKMKGSAGTEQKEK